MSKRKAVEFEEVKNVGVSKKRRGGRLCQECTIFASFGTEWKNPLFCARHKLDGMKNVVSKRCEAPGCESRPTFGREKGKALYCALHFLDGMKNVKDKVCQEPECETRPTYGVEWKKPTHCVSHALEGMKNVKAKRCEHLGCEIQATCGTQWRKPIYCSLHKTDEMKDVINKRCEEIGCETQPIYGFTWGKTLRCALHALDGMKDVKNKKCQDPGCEIQPTYGNDYKHPTHCVSHALEGMKNVINKRCEHLGCEIHATYGFLKNKPIYCSSHSLEGMQDVTTRKVCQEPGCEIKPIFGLIWKNPLFCKAHALEGMKDVSNKTCQDPDCQSRPFYGNHITGRAFCLIHKDPTQHWNLTTCKSESCKRVATHSQTGALPFVFCDKHRPLDFQSAREQRCLDCKFLSICNVDQLCEDCEKERNGYRKITEDAMNDFLLEKGLVFKRDRAPAGSCTAKRPDFVFQTPFGMLIVENDEHQHNSNLCACEQSRMMELHQSFGEAVHFIRFNPHRFIQSSTGKSGFVKLPRRHGELWKIIQKLLRDPQEFFNRFPYLSVRYMYYDNCDTPVHFNNVQTITY